MNALLEMQQLPSQRIIIHLSYHMQTLSILDELLETVFLIMTFNVRFMFQMFLKFLLLPERRYYVYTPFTERTEANKQDQQEKIPIQAHEPFISTCQIK